MIHCHRHHVEADEQHDDHIEFLIGDYFEQYCLWTPLQLHGREKMSKMNNNMIVGIAYISARLINNAAQ